MVAQATMAVDVQPVLGPVASERVASQLAFAVRRFGPTSILSRFCWCTVLVHLPDALADYLGPF